MLGLLLFHISAVVCWSGSLLYLPALMAATASLQTQFEHERQKTVMFVVYRLISTPAALLAIVSGTALFITGNVTDRWLFLKLGLVTVLVLCHASIGLLMLAVEKTPDRNRVYYFVSLQVAAAFLIPMIIWTVLTKPL